MVFTGELVPFDVMGFDAVFPLDGGDFRDGGDLLGEELPAFAAGMLGGRWGVGADDDPEVIVLEVDGHAGEAFGRELGELVFFPEDGIVIDGFFIVPGLGEGEIGDGFIGVALEGLADVGSEGGGEFARDGGGALIEDDIFLGPLPDLEAGDGGEEFVDVAAKLV